MKATLQTFVFTAFAATLLAAPVARAQEPKKEEPPPDAGKQAPAAPPRAP